MVDAKLIILNVEKIQNEINKIVKANSSVPIIFISLNKTHESLEKIFKSEGIDSSKLFIIDCVANEQKSQDVIGVKPTELDRLCVIINAFINEIKGEKILVVDALSTLLIYNSENAVASFVKVITEYASEKNVDVIALTPKTEGEELLKKIFNFFAKVENK